MLYRIWAQIACKMAIFFNIKNILQSSQNVVVVPPAIMLKVACLTGDVIKIVLINMYYAVVDR